MKKQWISVKCGLSRDPKHRQAMGESVWLFLHILDIASWEDGIAHEWKDEAAAEDMGMPVRTLREHRRRLDELGYITCVQKQYGQDIVVHNWTNPREYNGQVYNSNQGYIKREAQKGEQGYTQGYTQGIRKDVTPTSYSNNKESNDRYSKIANALATLQGGGLKLTDADTISVWLEKHTDEWIIKAIDKAKSAGARSSKYVDSVLIGWEAGGYPKTRDEQIKERKGNGYGKQLQPVTTQNSVTDADRSIAAQIKAQRAAASV